MDGVPRRGSRARARLGRAWALLLTGLLSSAAWVAAAEPAKTGFDDPPIAYDRIRRSSRFEADGTARTVVAVRVRPLNAAGVQRLGRVVVPYLRGRNTIELRHLRVIRPDGSKLEVDRRKILDLPAPVTISFAFYSDLHWLHVLVPALDVGDVVEYEIEDRLRDPDTPGRFGTAHDFERSVPVTEEVLELDVPTGLTIQLRHGEGLAPVVSERGGRRTYRWTSAGRQASKDRDEPPDVELSSFGSWDEVGRWYAGLAEGRARAGRRIRELAEEVAGEAATDMDRLEAIFHHVAREVRYLGLGLGIARYQPQEAPQVAANGYGDCKDKHTLLEALAGAQGLEAYPALVSTYRQISAEVPGAHQFDHLISVVRVGDELVWLDATSQVTPFRYLGDHLRGKQALVVGLDGASVLRRVPDTLPFASSAELDFAGEVTSEGALAAQVSYRLRGDEEYLLRSLLFAGDPALREAVAKSVVESALGRDFEVEELSTGPIGETERPLELTFRVRLEGYADPLSDSQDLKPYLLKVPLPEVGAEEESLDLGKVLERRATFQVTLPEGFEARAPAGSAMTSGVGSYATEYSVDGRAISARRTFTLHRGEIGPDEYREYQALRSNVRSDDRQRFLVRQDAEARASRAAGADAEQLYQAGKRAYAGKDYEGAIDLLWAAVDADPDHAGAWLRLGMALVEEEQFEDGVVAIQKSNEIDPYLKAGFGTLGWALELSGDVEAAEAAYRRQIEVYPLDPYPHVELGRLLEKRDRCDLALEHLEKAAALKKGHARTKMRLGRCLLAVGQGDRGEALIRESLEETESAWEIGVAGQRALGARRFELAVGLLTRATELAPEYESAYRDLGLALEALGRLEEAAAAFRRQEEVASSKEAARSRVAQ